MTNWTIFKIIFFHFYLYSSVLSHIYFLHIKNPLYNVKKTSNIEKKLFSLNFWGSVFSKITNSNAQKWVIFRRKKIGCKISFRYIGNFLGCVLFEMPPTAHPNAHGLCFMQWVTAFTARQTTKH